MTDTRGIDTKAALSKIEFQSLIEYYNTQQKHVTEKLSSLAANTSGTSPGQFLLMQLEMARVTQTGDSISNVISQVNSMINNAIRNLKGQ